MAYVACIQFVKLITLNMVACEALELPFTQMLDLKHVESVSKKSLALNGTFKPKCQ